MADRKTVGVKRHKRSPPSSPGRHGDYAPLILTFAHTGFCDHSVLDKSFCPFAAKPQAANKMEPERTWSRAACGLAAVGRLVA